MWQTGAKLAVGKASEAPAAPAISLATATTAKSAISSVSSFGVGLVITAGELAGGAASKAVAEEMGAGAETTAIVKNAGGGAGAVGTGAAVGAMLGGPPGALAGALMGGLSSIVGKGVEYGVDAFKSQWREGVVFQVRIRMDQPRMSFSKGELFDIGITSLELTSPWPAQIMRGYKGDLIVHLYKKMIVEVFDDDNKSHGSVQWQLPGRHAMSYGGSNVAKLKITSLEH